MSADAVVDNVIIFTEVHDLYVVSSRTLNPMYSVARSPSIDATIMFYDVSVAYNHTATD